MSVKTHTNEVMIYYDRGHSRQKKVLAMARTVSPHVREVELSKSPLTSTLMRDLLKKLDLRPKDLLDRSNDYYQENIRGRDFNAEGWLNILIKNPHLLKAPIAVRGDRAVLCENATDLLRLQYE
jgi:arsenate reductase